MKIKILALTFLLLAAAPAGAQRKVSADVEVKTVINGKVTTVTKSVYCSNNGRLVTLFHKPISYYTVANQKGEMQLYNPSTNEVMTQIDPSLSTNTDLVALFMNGRIDDLGLGWFGYKATSTDKDGQYAKKTFTSEDPSKPNVEIVYENWLPIYCAYTGKDGKLLSKKYLSNYQYYGRFVLPLRVTDIAYGTKRDSSVVRTIYSDVRVDQDDPNFNFEVPAGAKPMELPDPGK